MRQWIDTMRARLSQLAASRQRAARGPEDPEAAGRKKTFQERQAEARLAVAVLKEWSRIHLRRLAHLLHGATAENRVVGPASFLLVAATLGTALTLTTLYSTSYAVTVDGDPVGVVADQSVVDQAIQTVEATGSALLGYDYQVEGDVDYQFALTLKSDLSEERDIQNYFYGQLNELSDQLRAYEVSVAGRAIGVVKDEDALHQMLDSLKAEYSTQDTVSAEFVEDLEIGYVYAVQDLMTIDEMETALKANSTGETTYTVVQGDTFNGIAYANDMSVSDLKALNPGVDINRLMVGDVLNVKELIPTLSVRTVDHVTYTEAIECPVEEVEDDTMYEGTSKVLVQGTEGESLVTANVVYVDGEERSRAVVSQETLREPTVTTMAVGTKERPRTMPTGTYVWPVYGRINSYFGYRSIFGGRSYHSGLDIDGYTGETIVASDGGKVTFSGWKSGYGYVIIISHGSGVQTYYAHCSKLLVSAGTEVYQGQAIALVGSTGRSTGPHCHFEIRINGTAVNPLSYLP